jgi:hypothetical protein
VRRRAGKGAVFVSGERSLAAEVTFFGGGWTEMAEGISAVGWGREEGRRIWSCVAGAEGMATEGS